jgi:hypothetical protein
MCFAGVAPAQQQTGKTAPPKVLTITREFVKPGRNGSLHEKTESAFVQAMARANWPTHYLAVDSVSGKSRSLFFTGYDSFSAWEKDAAAQVKNSALAASLDSAAIADGDLLDAIDLSTWTFNEEMSLNPGADIGRTRYFEIEVFHIKPGHNKDWSDAVKLVKDAYAKANPDIHWDTFEGAYGQPHGTYLIITPMKSASEIDDGYAKDAKFRAAMGEDGMKKLGELSAAAIESSESNLFIVNPRMSYVPDDWKKEDPDFWNAKPTTATTDPASKPKAASGQ